MSKLRLSIAVGDYDITRPLLDGTVVPAGTDPIVLTAPSPQRHWRTLTHQEFDVAELSLGSYVAGYTAGDSELVAIPAFPHRRFRHGYAFASVKDDVRQPADFAGGSIGVRRWQNTAGVWLRGILGEYHDLDLASVRWVAQDREDIPLALAPEVQLERVPEGRSVTDMCASGELTGLIYPEVPRQIREGDGTIRRVFDDPKSAEQDYFRRTGIFPIMHLVAIRAELVTAHPWLPRAILDAFVEAKRLALLRLANPRTVSLAWLSSLQDEERALMGPDPWCYGWNELNRSTIETFLRYATEQGVARRPVTPAELFAASTLDSPPTYV